MSLFIILPFLVLASIGLAALLTPLVRRWAFAAGAVDRPTGGRKIHHVPTALWGGLVTGTVIIIGLLVALLFADGKELHPDQLIGFIIAIVVLMIGGALDDKFNLPPAVQFLFPLLAALIVVGSGSSISLVTNPFASGGISLTWSQLVIGLFVISWPADVVTILWLLVVTYAMKFLDGLDGLAAGMVIISSGLIAALASSDAYFQPIIALIALMIAGVHLGFLPWNRQGSIFLGEGGSTIAGFSLAVLAVISGAKLATAATALAVPLVDIVLVIGGRLLAGASPFKGDARHLHFRLLQAGFKPRATARMIWGIGLAFGLMALTLQTRGKFFLLIGLALLICTLSVITWRRDGEKKK